VAFSISLRCDPCSQRHPGLVRAAEMLTSWVFNQAWPTHAAEHCVPLPNRLPNGH